MMNYRKGRNVEEELTRNDIQIENLPEDFLWMHVSSPTTRIAFSNWIKILVNFLIFFFYADQVKGGTAVPNVIEFAKKALQSGEHRTIVWTGYGGGVGKTISCAEVLKRDFTLHQVTRLCYKTYEKKICCNRFHYYWISFDGVYWKIEIFPISEMKNTGILCWMALNRLWLNGIYHAFTF